MSAWGDLQDYRDYQPFEPAAWFWQIGNDVSRFWSSAAGAYVDDAPVDRLTRIASEADLSDVLRGYGMKVPAPREIDYQLAVQNRVDQTARSRQYSDGVALASYAQSTIPQWAAEAAAFISWRDATWLYAYGELAKVQAGQRAQPDIAQLVSELPAITWPD